ncbi:DNA-methyltransferase [Lactobacillus crispatus]|uniref:DNA-methyltransferase n=1 Tax=Lactobacillus crispatus TaxID=47770 RepID=UPI001F08E3BD|nr:DNA methyltransferase [Lactobacillus crispatus]MCT7677284.1 DNA methyltransferase [Lactobacillus iners]MCT7740548.1 DNA methyltransferase [Lactobacillus crispatus]MCT7745414.1 DNA methyltransferase [Lactobacillus crispatus]MCT7819453.1 DNA methyltransferase [Lactobacillus crispatus]MCT7834234.1 DNA methyltransferase [Lactobacillus iners]
MIVKQGDCLVEMSRLKTNSVDLVYLDPPFFTNKRHRSTSKSDKDISFNDNWDSKEQYIQYMSERLKEAHRVLKETGNIFVHCDNNASYIFRDILEKIFGSSNFQSEIIWTYKRWSNSKRGLINAHQTILFYSKTSKFKFNRIYTDYSPTTNVDQLLQERVRDSNNKTVYKRDDNGNTIAPKAKKGVPLSNVWDIPYLNPKAEERVGYPTQKPLALLERIIRLGSDPGDVVLDPFCGSGTTLVAAKLLGREFIGFDVSADAINITNSRLANPIETKSRLLKKGVSSYITKNEMVLNLLHSINAKPVFRNKSIDGIINDLDNDQLILVKIQTKNESLEETKTLLARALNKKKLSRGLIIRTHKDEYLETSLMPSYSTVDIKVIDSYNLIIKQWLS